MNVDGVRRLEQFVGGLPVVKVDSEFLKTVDVTDYAIYVDQMETMFESIRHTTAE